MTVTAKKFTKKRDARAKLLFCLLNLFFRSLSRRRRRCLSPNNQLNSSGPCDFSKF